MLELKQARQKLDGKIGTSTSASNGQTQSQQQKSNKFVRVAIQEEDEEEEESKVSNDTETASKPVIEEVKSTAATDSNWWKNDSDIKYEDFKEVAKEEPKIEDTQPKSSGFKRVAIEEDDDEEEVAKSSAELQKEVAE